MKDTGSLGLDKMKIGQKGRITAVLGEGAVRRKLLDLGLTPNTEVLVRKIAPLGDPIEVTLRGFELTLRKQEAENVKLELVD